MILFPNPAVNVRRRLIMHPGLETAGGSPWNIGGVAARSIRNISPGDNVVFVSGVELSVRCLLGIFAFDSGCAKQRGSVCTV